MDFFTDSKLNCFLFLYVCFNHYPKATLWAVSFALNQYSLLKNMT